MEGWSEDGGVPEPVRALIKRENALLDEAFPAMESMLRARRADECWHKHGTFLDHLTGVWRLATVWRQDRATSRCGLFHSAYGNGRVNLAIFRSADERGWLREVLGEDAEALTFLFCTVNRRAAVYGTLVPMVEAGQPIPAGGVDVEAVAGRPVATVHLSVRDMFRVLVLTMADFADQNYGYQDRLFNHEQEGVFQFTGENPRTLWPGDSRPGLFMSGLSRLAKTLRAVVAAAPEELEPLVPPVLDRCRFDLPFADDLEVVRLYWRAVTECADPDRHDEAMDLLRRAVALNPHVAEPRLLLAQMLMHRREFGEAYAAARVGLELLCLWGTAWDKRVTWETWISVARMMVQQARRSEWPETSWGMISLGMVQ
jgi:hypothetical protein